MSTQAIGSAVLTASALRSVNFFNGRLLTGDDLAGEQAAQEARLARVGRLVGEGVASGLEVAESVGSSTAPNPIVTVSAGLAVSRSGLALELPSAVDLALARAAVTSASEPGGLFADCQPFAPGTYTAGAGVYLLTIGPAEQGEGLAPVTGLGNQPSPCNVARSVETVQFRLIRLALTADELSDRAQLRSLIAYRCFAPDALASFTRDPFGMPPTTYGLLDELRAQILSDDEVPLALIGWSIDAGIQFVDLWSVRRRLIRRSAEGDLALFAGDRRRAEGEAMFLQFQGQLADLRAQVPVAAAVRAVDNLHYLPPAGLLPLESTAAISGFDMLTFLAGIPQHPPVFLEGARVEHLLLTAFAFPPIDLLADIKEAVRLYLIRENQTAAPGEAPAKPYLILTSGHVPYGADARYDLALWNYANYAER